MERTLIQRLKLAIQGKPRTAPRHKSLMLNTLHKSSPASFRRSRTHRDAHRRIGRKSSRIAKTIRQKERRNGGVSTSEEADEKEAVERKIRALQSIVPGGESLGVDKLFEQTAEYIMNLQHQVKAMRALSSFFETLEKEKSKCGG
ncbi:transcription factor PAR2 [Momordica charantia]|uniref:Transcription factor PAR2 n=1 Tax=Momordica charantia TaxID=3673 RepID=A0A6J1D2S3_MOMCH|nr:transcription factor PAR2 [Momordica charantia]